MSTHSQSSICIARKSAVGAAAHYQPGWKPPLPMGPPPNASRGPPTVIRHNPGYEAAVVAGRVQSVRSSGSSRSDRSRASLFDIDGDAGVPIPESTVRSQRSDRKSSRSFRSTQYEHKYDGRSDTGRSSGAHSKSRRQAPVTTEYATTVRSRPPTVREPISEYGSSLTTDLESGNSALLARADASARRSVKSQSLCSKLSVSRTVRRGKACDTERESLASHRKAQMSALRRGASETEAITLGQASQMVHDAQSQRSSQCPGRSPLRDRTSTISKRSAYYSGWERVASGIYRLPRGHPSRSCSNAGYPKYLWTHIGECPSLATNEYITMTEDCMNPEVRAVHHPKRQEHRLSEPHRLQPYYKPVQMSGGRAGACMRVRTTGADGTETSQEVAADNFHYRQEMPDGGRISIRANHYVRS